MLLYRGYAHLFQSLPFASILGMVHYEVPVSVHYILYIENMEVLTPIKEGLM